MDHYEDGGQKKNYHLDSSTRWNIAKNIKLLRAELELFEEIRTASYMTNDGQIKASRASGGSLQIRRRTDDGVVALFYRDTTNVGSISVTTTSTAYNTSSDARLKIDLGGFSLRDLAAPLFSLRLRKYRWKAWGDTDRAAYGVFAQEALETNPWMVNYDKASDQYGVNWMAAMPNVIAAVQVHEDEITQLRREVAELKAKLAGLEFR